VSINDSGGFSDAIGPFSGVSMTSGSEGNSAPVGKFTQFALASLRYSIGMINSILGCLDDLNLLNVFRSEQ